MCAVSALELARKALEHGIHVKDRMSSPHVTHVKDRKSVHVKDRKMHDYIVL